MVGTRRMGVVDNVHEYIAVAEQDLHAFSHTTEPGEYVVGLPALVCALSSFPDAYTARQVASGPRAAYSAAVKTLVRVISITCGRKVTLIVCCARQSIISILQAPRRKQAWGMQPSVTRLLNIPLADLQNTIVGEVARTDRFYMLDHCDPEP